MAILLSVLLGTLAFVLLIIAGVIVYALPATFSLPRGQRPGVEPLTLEQAAEQLRRSGATGWDLVEQARRLVGERMAYCRRNSFDWAPRAFSRGYGYCQQRAYALKELLERLGFRAEVVQSVRTRFPDGVGGHAWIRVWHEGESRDIDPEHMDPQTGQLLFTPLSPVTAYTGFFRILAGWGSTAVNAHRYYRTGKDQ